MGVIDNLKKIKKSQDNKNAVSKIARKAVTQGRVESDFLAEYNSFSVALKEVLEKNLVMNKNKSLTISANNDNGKGENLKYLNYVLEDEEYTALYEMKMDRDANIIFKLKYVSLDDDDTFGDLVNTDNNIDNDFKKDVDFFLNS